MRGMTSRWITAVEVVVDDEDRHPRVHMPLRKITPDSVNLSAVASGLRNRCPDVARRKLNT